MATDQGGVRAHTIEQPELAQRPLLAARRGGGWGRIVLALVAVLGLGAVGYYLATSGHARTGQSEHSAGSEHGGAAHSEGGASGGAARVEVVRPKAGGMEMVTTQPGTVHAFDFARLYAKVSGYVKELKVDRGSRVKKDDLLLTLYVPELVAAVEQARASLERARAAVVQAEARVKSASQTVVAKKADVEKAESDLRAAAARREYRDKQYVRIRQLVERGAVEQRLLDEEEDRRAAAHEEEAAAKSAVAAARAHVYEAEALLAQAEADLKGAQADVNVSRANLDKELALQSYTKITSPYDGVVIFRGEAVHPGAFIQSADQGLGDPMLTVASDAVMRAIIPVPDRDVPYCDLGDPAIVTVDALKGREFKGTVSRIADSEDVNDRTMRVEVDIANPLVNPNSQTRVLRDGMYGRTTIILEKATKNLTVPSTAILDRDSEGKGTVQVVRDGKMYRQHVVIGRDTGSLAEIISGLTPDAEVLVQPDVSMADGTPVQVESGAVAEAPKAAAATGHS
jgi:RND family efflux transporter MFP subunit